MKKAKKKARVYKLVNTGDIVFAPCSKDIYRMARVVDTQVRNENLALRIEFDTGAVHFISAELCFRIVSGVAIAVEKPKTKLQRFCIWFLRKLGLSEV